MSVMPYRSIDPPLCQVVDESVSTPQSPSSPSAEPSAAAASKTTGESSQHVEPSLPSEQRRLTAIHEIQESGAPQLWAPQLLSANEPAPPGVCRVLLRSIAHSLTLTLPTPLSHTQLLSANEAAGEGEGDLRARARG